MQLSLIMINEMFQILMQLSTVYICGRASWWWCMHVCVIWTFNYRFRVRSLVLHWINLYENTAVTFASLLLFQPISISAPPKKKPPTIFNPWPPLFLVPTRGRPSFSLRDFFSSMEHMPLLRIKTPHAAAMKEIDGKGRKYKGGEEVDLHKRECDARYSKTHFRFHSFGQTR